ncbi:hypothetical protein JTE90_028469 [Oedothorax gibbosus]|uniref:Peptidase A2 domain-containing protein n=1 Tax=Oedothorax gibbosus TaxID=931172 RepID=A0AAV6VGU4_9ARAC|nr:hypothetical protein JTE90_028469 [Oedothorax gibbosus]
MKTSNNGEFTPVERVHDNNARKNFVKENSLCENCLRSHPRSSCTSSNCRRCNKSHNTLLHEDSTEVQAASGDPEVAQPETTSHFSRYPPSRQITLMPTVIIEVLNIYGQKQPCKMLMDSGSQTSFISERCNSESHQALYPLVHL